MNDQTIAQNLEGVHYDTAAGEYAVYVGGEIVGYAGEYGAAWGQYLEALGIIREHARRNPANLAALVDQYSVLTEAGI